MNNTETGIIKETNILYKVGNWFKSVAGITICITIFLAIFGSIDQGPYILINTLVTGGMWALMAMGLALVFGVMNISNFAHGEFFMVGSLTAYYVFTPMQNYVRSNPGTLLSALAPIIAIIGATLAGAVAGVLADRLVFYPLRRRSKQEWLMNCFLLTLGISVILIYSHQLIFGTTFKGIPSYWNVKSISIFGVYLSFERLFVSILSIVVIFTFWLFMKVTRIGRAIRAVSQDESGALLMGISVDRIQTLAMALSSGMAALAGGSLLFMYPAYPMVGLEPLYNSWFVIVVVGFGNVGGAIAGGFIIALFQLLTRVYLGEGWEYVVPVLLIALILIIKPNGIFGSKVRGIWER